jgi:hypothetical protein
MTKPLAVTGDHHMVFRSRPLALTRMSIDRCRLQVSMAEGRRHERDRRPVAGVGYGHCGPAPNPFRDPIQSLNARSSVLAVEAPRR